MQAGCPIQFAPFANWVGYAPTPTAHPRPPLSSTSPSAATPPPPPAKLSLVMVLAILLIAAAAYLLGSIPTGYLLIRLFRHQDIRQTGSGNIGATNVLRSGGKGLGAATFLLDMLKGCSAVWLGALPRQPAAAPALALQRRSPGRAACRPWPRLPGLATLPRRQGRRHRLRRLSGRHAPGRAGRHLRLLSWSSRSAAMSRWPPSSARPAFRSLPISWSTATARRSSSPCEIAVALLIIVKHHQNIRRLLAGTESRFGAKRRPHEPHHRLRFRRLGNRHRPLAPPPRRPPDLALGAQPGVRPGDHRRRRKQALSSRLSHSRQRSPSPATTPPSPTPRSSSPSSPRSFSAPRLPASRPHLHPGQIIVSATKGVEDHTFLRMTQVIAASLAESGLTLPIGALQRPQLRPGSRPGPAHRPHRRLRRSSHRRPHPGRILFGDPPPLHLDRRDRRRTRRRAQERHRHRRRQSPPESAWATTPPPRS